MGESIAADGDAETAEVHLEGSPAGGQIDQDGARSTQELETSKREQARRDEESERLEKRRDRRQTITLTVATAVIAALVSFGTNFLTAHQSAQAADRATSAQERLAEQNFTRERQQTAYQDFVNAGSALGKAQAYMIDVLYNYSEGSPGLDLDAEWRKENTAFDDLVAKEMMIDLIGSSDTADRTFDVVAAYQEVENSLYGALPDAMAKTFDVNDRTKIRAIFSNGNVGKAEDMFTSSGRRDLGLPD